MEGFYTRIGEHVIHILSDSNQLVCFFGKGFRECVNPNIQPDLTLHLISDYGVPFVNFDVRITRFTDHIEFCRADYLIRVDRDYKRAYVFVHDELALKHALINLYSSFIVYHHWGLLIHSSCVIEKGQAHIFAGQSGAGKSTAARLSYPRELLSDEAAIVKIDTKGTNVFDSPFRSEEVSHGFNESRPLASIQLLVQARQNQRIRLSKSDALLHLIDKVFYWPHSSDETSRIIGFLKILVNAVPVYELHFKKNNTFWELIS